MLLPYMRASLKRKTGFTFPHDALVTKKPEQFTCPGLIVNEGEA
jgi:hypothetical protein